MAVTERIRGRLSTGPITLCGGMMVEQQVHDRGHWRRGNGSAEGPTEPTFRFHRLRLRSPPRPASGGRSCDDARAAHPGPAPRCGGRYGPGVPSLRPQVGGVVVSDLSGEMLRNARKKAGLDGVRARTEQLPFPDGAFERIIVVDALHHFARREEALAELVRVLKLPVGC